MFYIRLSTIFLILALIDAAVFAGCMVYSWWSRKKEREDPCYNCYPGNSGVCVDCPRRNK